MESVFVKNMPEATVNRTNQKKKKKNLREMSQPEFTQSSLRFFFCCFFVFFVFLLYCAKSFLVELWADKRMQKVDLGGGASIYIYI